MKRLFILLLLATLTPVVQAQEILLETEAFCHKGGWVVDQQFIGTMGSSYLLAHGAGQCVEDAATQFDVPKRGTYYVYARTYNWTAPFFEGRGPGRFQIRIGAQTLPAVLGDEGDAWQWQEAGKIRLDKGPARIALHDLTGFEGRCDAIYLTTKRGIPADTDTEQLRRRLTPGYDTAAEGGTFDFVVVGGGYAGICAAVSAARLGLRVALLQDRAVLGGNNSSEVRVQMGRSIECEPYPALGNLLKEFAPTRKGNAMPASYYGDDEKLRIVTREKNISLFLLTRAIAVEMQGARIAAVLGRHVETGALTRFRAPLFADCTGDATIGVLAGADYRVGREARSEYGERNAVETADNQVLGASLQWSSKQTDSPVEFPDFVYGCRFTDESVQQVTKGLWTWETGMRQDQVAEAEAIRDYGLLVIYSNWAYLKNHAPYRDEYRNRALDWVSYVSGKRESRRLLGDVVLTQTDLENNVQYPDASATASWTIDLHYPEPENSRHFPGREFKSVCMQIEVPLNAIPYRCFYSRNVENLFMAGRNISVTHIALGSVRVMRTTAMMGEVVGMAAKVCHTHAALPRAVYTDHLDELQR